MKIWPNFLNKCFEAHRWLRSEWQGTAILIFLSVTTAVAQETASLVIYSRQALIRETRELTIDAGGMAKVSGFPPGMQFESVWLESPDGKTIPTRHIRFQRLQAGLPAMLQQVTGSDVVVYSKTLGRVSGTLMAASGGKLYLRTTDQTLRVLSGEDVVAYDFPPGDYLYRSQTELEIAFRDRVSTQKRFRLNYLTGGFSWRAHYTAVFRRDQDRLTLTGRFIIENRTELRFEKASITLVAGATHRDRPPVQPVFRAKEKSRVAGSEPVERKRAFEYYVYHLADSIQVKPNDQLLIPFLPPKPIPFRKHYIYDPRLSSTDVFVRLELTNDKPLFGEPLPAGRVQVYQEQAPGRLFLGEDRIRHTPVGETVWLSVGRAFDIKAEREKLAQARVGPKSRSETYSIRLRNHKTEPVIVRVVERFSGNWSISQSTDSVTAQTADRVEWELQIPARKSKELRYTVLFDW